MEAPRVGCPTCQRVPASLSSSARSGNLAVLCQNRCASDLVCVDCLRWSAQVDQSDDISFPFAFVLFDDRPELTDDVAVFGREELDVEAQVRERCPTKLETRRRAQLVRRDGPDFTARLGKNVRSSGRMQADLDRRGFRGK